MAAGLTPEPSPHGDERERLRQQLDLLTLLGVYDRADGTEHVALRKQLN